MAKAEAESYEEIFTTVPQVAPGSGAPMAPFGQYRVPKRMADIRYQRGMARPAAEVYLERLRAMGVVAIGITKDAMPSVRLAAQKTGVAVKVGPAPLGAAEE